jgi:tRNA pseudouridine55 synthase
VNKPQDVTSADVIRKLKEHFNPSALFKPCLDLERESRSREPKKERRKRRIKQLELKMGHGGTLDPLASGVLIIGVLRGTKDLPNFLGACKKTYEATVLFGAETDTHDCLGKIVRTRGYDHVTRDKVEAALDRFRGRFLQNPPLFSALKYKGKKLYEYAREGKVPPVQPEPRPVDVSKLEIVQWYDPGEHEFRWPEQAPKEEREAAEKILGQADSMSVAASGEGQESESGGSLTKRKSPPTAEGPADDTDTPAEQSAKKQKVTAEGDASQPEQPEQPSVSDTQNAETSTAPKEADPAPLPQPPAVKVRMTVSSGFYVRSFAHDLGRALDSCGIMTSLARTQQGDYTLDPEKVLDYKDLEAGEEVWGPKVKQFLVEWEQRKAAESNAAGNGSRPS